MSVLHWSRLGYIRSSRVEPLSEAIFPLFEMKRLGAWFYTGGGRGWPCVPAVRAITAPISEIALFGDTAHGHI